MINPKLIPISSGIYKITNKINNKVYVGQAVNLQRRILIHLYDYKYNKKNSYFYNSITKYGIENFDVEILIEGKFSKLELNEMEIRFIELFNSTNKLFGYNMTKGGNGGCISRKQSDETKRKISESKKGKKHSGETKQKISKTKLGSKTSQETKEKMSNSAKGKPKSEQHCENISKANIGKKQS